MSVSEDQGEQVWSLVIEFDSEADYDEFVREHVGRRCSDLSDWNAYRVTTKGS